jgi:D-inositol-3-phosphate glycosyltransferase
MHVLLTGWFSFLHDEVTAGDVLALEAVRSALDGAGVTSDTAWSPVFRPGALRLEDAAPDLYSHLIFVCGPIHGAQVSSLHQVPVRGRIPHSGGGFGFTWRAGELPDQRTVCHTATIVRLASSLSVSDRLLSTHRRRGSDLKIDMVSEHASPLATLGTADAGGQNVHVAELAIGLGRRGHRVTVYTRREDPDLPTVMHFSDGVTLVHVPAGPAHPVAKDDLLPHMPSFAVWLEERWSARPPDVVHAHFWMSGLAAVQAAAASAVPVVQTFHALGSVKQRMQGAADTSPPQRLRLEASVGRQVDAVIATCSDEVRELATYEVPPDRIFVVPCGVDGDRFRATGPVARRGRRPRVLTVGRLVPRKGVETVIAAMPFVADAELVIAGGPDPDLLSHDAEAGRLHALANEHRVADRVVFLGRTSHQDVPALMRSADVVVADSWYEPFGIVPVEAMACGRSVIASAVGGHLDTVVDGVTGLLVPPRNVDALGSRLRQLLGDRRLRHALGTKATDHARNRYLWPLIAAETEAVYERVLTSRIPPYTFANGTST